jgi:SAM-dependent MidA family methyltransferase
MNVLTKIISDEIAKNGVVTFARFMDIALYHPEHGYYERETSPGKDGDFFTSVSVGSLFGELLGFQITQWLAELPEGTPPQIVEAGAHDGQLAKDILAYFKEFHPRLFGQVRYLIAEPSMRRRERQKKHLAEFADDVTWIADLAELKHRHFNGIIFSNELLDAMPVHRFGWDAAQKKWFEWGVGWEGGKFAWQKIWDTTFKTHHPELDAVLPDGYVVEVSSAAKKWWHAAAEAIEHGWLMTFDYGLSMEEVFSPSRKNGTVRAYRQHHVTHDVLEQPGEQDLTAHVNFSTIQKVGEDSGLMTEFHGSQSRFLTGVLARAAKSQSFGAWDPARTRQFQTLTHPEHLGRSFRVLVQSR